MATPENLGDEDFESLDELEELDEEESDLGDEISEPAAGKQSDDLAGGDTPAAESDDDEETLDEEGDDEEEESLDVILAREQDLEEEFATVGESTSRQPSTTTPAGEDEFTCRSCFLVKRRAQLADAGDMICTDCA